MRNLILEALRTSVKQYPEVIPLLQGDAALYARVYAYKVGEAPDDDVRVRDENLLTETVNKILREQQKRIVEVASDDYSRLLDRGFWDNELRLIWSGIGEDVIAILMHGVVGGLQEIADEARERPKFRADIKSLEERIIWYALTYRNQWLQLINENTREFVQESIAAWVQSGDPITELFKILSNPELNIFNLMRAKRIATTEVTRLYAMANQAAWVESGVVSQFRWMTAVDELRCETCRENHNLTFPLTELDALIPAHPNCRCWAQPIVNRDMSQDRLDQILGEYGL